ncbi:hypothetical protein GS531_23300 [Rhodococcus hoagii]|nr:hypothetical protein [Prescottella equi]
MLIDNVGNLGRFALMGGSVWLVLNLITTVALPFASDVSWQVVGASGLVALAGAVLGLGGYGLMRVSSGWERKHGILTAGDIVAAPKELRTPLVAALTAADKIRASTAYRDQWLTNIDLDAALWDLARHVQIGTTLTAQLHGLAEIDEQHQHDDEAEAARTSLAAVTDRVRGAAQRLSSLALRVADLDAQLAEPARRAALEAQRTRSEVAAAQRAAQMTETRAALDGSTRRSTPTSTPSPDNSRRTPNCPASPPETRTDLSEGVAMSRTASRILAHVLDLEGRIPWNWGGNDDPHAIPVGGVLRSARTRRQMLDDITDPAQRTRKLDAAQAYGIDLDDHDEIGWAVHRPVPSSFFDPMTFEQWIGNEATKMPTGYLPISLTIDEERRRGVQL